MGRISKTICQDISATLRTALNINQWRNTDDCIQWFKNINTYKNWTFIKYDIKDFHPSITENTINKSVDLAKEYITIPDEKIQLIHHCRKSILYHNNEIWIKKGANNYDVAMGSYNGAEICEIVGCLLLYNLNEIMDPSYHGLYRDDGLAILEHSTPKKADTLRKKLHNLFNKFGFKIEIQTNLTITDYLDISLNLNNGTISPYIKPTHTPLYINTGSNHPKQIFKHIPTGITTRLSKNSSNKTIFNKTKNIYEQALKSSGFKTKLEYKEDSLPNSQNENKNKKRNRNRNIIWFTPPFNLNLNLNLGKIFFKILNNHFPPENKLHKIFNKNTIKLSYSCMPNIDKYINKFNIKKLNKNKNDGDTLPCNCRNGDGNINNSNNSNKPPCPLNSKCRNKNLVYKATVSDKNNKKMIYFGSTQNPFKNRYYNHTSSFKNIKYKNSTSLSKYVWDFKNKYSTDPVIKWEIVKRSRPYNPGDKFCHLCTEEKLTIACYNDSSHLLNQRSEIFAKCLHQRKWEL